MGPKAEFWEISISEVRRRNGIERIARLEEAEE